MSEKRYELLKDYEDPCGRVYKGAIKTEYQWMARFALLNEGDCAVKTDWFKEFVEVVTDPYEQIAKMCGLTYRGGNRYTDKFGRSFTLTKLGYQHIAYLSALEDPFLNRTP